MDNNMDSLSSKFSLSGKVALITGGAGLLGRAHAEALMQLGATVILTDINQEDLQIVNEKLSILPCGSIEILDMDVTSEESINRVLSHIQNRGFRLDILINNAAINPTASSLRNNIRITRLENFPLDTWISEINVGLTGAFLCSKIFGTAMAKDELGGVILNIASDLSVIAPNQALYRQDDLAEEIQAVKPVTYSIIKTGLIGLTRYLSSYWAHKGIRCNALSPGGVYDGQSDEFVNRLQDIIPMGRMATKDEYVGAIQFLCSDASAYMNGQNIVIDGGRSVI